jgi:hypothetical protein
VKTNEDALTDFGVYLIQPSLICFVIEKINRLQAASPDFLKLFRCNLIHVLSVEHLSWRGEEDVRLGGTRDIALGTKHIFFTEGARQHLEHLR